MTADEYRAEKIVERSMQCERGIVNFGLNYKGEPVAALILVGPDSILYRQELPLPDMYFDLNLN